MEDNRKSELKTRLMGELEKAERELAAMKESTSAVAPDNAIGRLTRMDAIAWRGVNVGAANAKQERINSLLKALSRLDDPKFGICSECGEPIAPARLEYMPETSTCVNCAS